MDASKGAMEQEVGSTTASWHEHLVLNFFLHCKGYNSVPASRAAAGTPE
jgi:hypothetical protein